MLFLILKNPDDNRDSYYKGAICLYEGKPYYVTSIARPEIFKTESQAENVVRKFGKKTGNVFTVISMDFYLTLLDKRGEPSWVTQLRQEQMEINIDG